MSPPTLQQPPSPPRDRVRTVVQRIPWLVIAGLAVGVLLFALLWLSQRDDRLQATDVSRPGSIQRVFDPLPTPSPAAGRPTSGARDPAPQARGERAAGGSTALPAQTPTIVEPMPDTGARLADSPAATPGRTTDPVPVTMPAPKFPPAALRRGAAGEVLLQVAVDPEGEPASIEVIQSSGSRDLDRSAIAAAGRWRFQPARRDGVAVPGVVNVPIRFDANR